MRAGATRKTAKKILKKIRSQIYQDMNTGDIYKSTQGHIRRKGAQSAISEISAKRCNYTIRASRIAFENYIESILQHYNLQPLKVRTKIKGKCAMHEIDVIGKSNSKLFLIECKYHSSHGVYTGLKEALYTHARFLDLHPKFGEIIFL